MDAVSRPCGACSAHRLRELGADPAEVGDPNATGDRDSFVDIVDYASTQTDYSL